MRQVSDLRQALADEVVRLQAAPGLERRVLDGAFRRPARAAAVSRALEMGSTTPRSFKAPALVAVLLTAAIVAALVFGAYRLQWGAAVPGAAPRGAVETATAPVAVAGPRAIDCQVSDPASGCDMQPPVFANANVGWLAVQFGNLGQSTNLYRTEDAGKHWRALISWDCDGPTEIETSRDGREALIVTGAGVCDAGVLHTTDAGAHWTSFGMPESATRCVSVAGNCTNSFDQIQFSSTKEGWLFAQGPTLGAAQLFHTDDSGAHWVVAATIQVDGPLQHLLSFDSHAQFFFTSRTDGWFLSTYTSSLYRTLDGGRTWDLVHIPTPGLDPATVRLRSLRFFGQNDGVMHIWSGTRLYVTTTSDGGNTWTSPRIMPGTPSLMSGLPALAMVGARTWYTMDQAGLLRTDDAGYTWTTVDASPPGCCWLVFYDVRHGLLLSDQQLYETTDGGAHWMAFPVPVEGATWSFPEIP